MNALLQNAANVVFDVGQVLLRFEPEAFFPLILSAQERERLTIPMVIDTDMWVRLDEGTVTEEEVARYAARLAGDDSLYGAALRVIQRFPEYMEELPAAGLVPQLHAMGKKVYVLSNYGFHTFARTEKRFHSLFGQMDGMVISSREKLLKPDPRIYRALLDRYQLRPEECVFIDDRAENILGARKVGMQGIVYTGMDALL